MQFRERATVIRHDTNPIQYTIIWDNPPPDEPDEIEVQRSGDAPPAVPYRQRPGAEIKSPAGANQRGKALCRRPLAATVAGGRKGRARGAAPD